MTLAQLLIPLTQSGALALVLAALQTVGFPVTNWVSGAPSKTFAIAFANVMAQLSATIAQIAAGGFIDYAPGFQTTPFLGDWLGLLAQQLYGLTRNAAITAQETCILSDVAGVGPITITAGQLFAQWTATGLQYSNVAGGTIPLNGQLSVVFQAAAPGAKYNAPVNQIQTLLTPLPGIAINNPGSGSPASAIVVQGTDTELDSSLRARCKARWPSLASPSATTAVYDLWCRTASAQVTRDAITADATVGGQVDIVLAGASGGVSGAVVTAVTNYITPLLPLCGGLSVVSATTAPIAFGGTIYCSAGLIPAAMAAINLALQAYINSLGIGGTPTGVIESSVVVAIMQGAAIPGITTGTPGVRNVEGATPGDTTLAAGVVATFGTPLTLANFVGI
jgi:uncharacterized phage protein gp47/JayE